MGMRRVKAWSRLADRSSFDYSAAPDEDLLRMKATARRAAALFMADGRAVFVAALDQTGLAGINLELWKRGLTPAQGGPTCD